MHSNFSGLKTPTVDLIKGKENLFNNQELLQLVIISFISVTLLFDSGVILLGEIRCLSLLGCKGLKNIPHYQRHRRDGEGSSIYCL